ncbi:hypothetical protein TW86_03990 [Halomonas sp. S2151]|uniref:tail fiber domain-containing protein n=1 Tax=Halomonas sp. S2151 TaxID=579478 RepID=UPI0005FA586D|nr:tail fiber domain-containing protein [Halomonas sp. S2151]KJZ17422.1 hypothetical protein TW86_03990 [Halomonas sp. S2151]
MQRYTDIDENTEVEDSRQLLLDNDMTSITNNSGVSFPAYAEAGTACYRLDHDRLYIKRVNGEWRMIADAAQTALTREEADQRYSDINHNHDTAYAPRQSPNRPGITKLYRSDADSGYNVQTTWTGTYWKLYGYNGDSAHAGCLVDRANSASSADNASKLNGLSAGNYLRSNTNSTFTASLTVNGNLTVKSSLTVSRDITSSSDARLKRDIATLEDATQKVKQLRGVSYVMKSSGEKGIGFVAQELQKVVPDVVRIGEDKKLSVAYGNITALLTEALKDVISRIEKLEAAA